MSEFMTPPEERSGRFTGIILLCSSLLLASCAVPGRTERDREAGALENVEILSELGVCADELSAQREYYEAVADATFTRPIEVDINLPNPLRKTKAERIGEAAELAESHDIPCRSEAEFIAVDGGYKLSHWELSVFNIDEMFSLGQCTRRLQEQLDELNDEPILSKRGKEEAQAERVRLEQSIVLAEKYNIPCSTQEI